MYDIPTAEKRCQEPFPRYAATNCDRGAWKRFLTPFLVALLLCCAAPVRARDYGPTSPVRHVSDLTDKLELTTNRSLILSLDKNIPRVQVNNPDLLAVTPLSATQVQVSAKKAGVTQVNLWDEDGNIHTVDVMIYGDARELEVALQTQFPNSAIKVYRYSESLVLKGFVDQPEYVSQIMRLAEDYAPKVINNIQVGGAQQVLLKVKVMEVSRTKLRQLGMDFAQVSSSGVIAASSVSQMIAEVAQVTGSAGAITPNIQGGPGVIDNLGTFQFGIVDGSDVFFGFLDALQQKRIAKTLAEPNIVAVSGRPAKFNVGGEIPILVPQSLGTTSIEYKPYGTEIDFVPIVLGNGNIRLEVRPRISDLDYANAITISGTSVPALTVRQVNTAVEMKAGQTFALAGLVQERTESVNRGLPYLSDVPYLGVPFRRVLNEVNEIELLIMVTPEFVDAIEPGEVPCGGPGFNTTNPNNTDLFWGGKVEVPNHCNPISGLTTCGGEDCYGDCQQPCTTGCQPVTTDGLSMPGGVGYDNDGVRYEPTMNAPSTVTDQTAPGPTPMPSGTMPPRPMPPPQTTPPTPTMTPPAEPDDMTLPSPSDASGAANPWRTQPSRVVAGPRVVAGLPTEVVAGLPTEPPPGPQVSPSWTGRPSVSTGAGSGDPRTTLTAPQYTVPRPYSPPRQPIYVRNAARSNEPAGQPASTAAPATPPGLIGPIGYDE